MNLTLPKIILTENKHIDKQSSLILLQTMVHHLAPPVVLESGKVPRGNEFFHNRTN